MGRCIQQQDGGGEVCWKQTMQQGVKEWTAIKPAGCLPAW